MAGLVLIMCSALTSSSRSTIISLAIILGLLIRSSLSMLCNPRCLEAAPSNVSHAAYCSNPLSCWNTHLCAYWFPGPVRIPFWLIMWNMALESPPAVPPCRIHRHTRLPPKSGVGGNNILAILRYHQYIGNPLPGIYCIRVHSRYNNLIRLLLYTYRLRHYQCIRWNSLKRDDDNRIYICTILPN